MNIAKPRGKQTKKKITATESIVSALMLRMEPFEGDENIIKHIGRIKNKMAILYFSQEI